MEIERNVPSGHNVTSHYLTSGRLVMAFSTSGCIVERKGMLHEKQKIETKTMKEEKDRKKGRKKERNEQRFESKSQFKQKERKKENKDQPRSSNIQTT